MDTEACFALKSAKKKETILTAFTFNFFWQLAGSLDGRV